MKKIYLLPNLFTSANFLCGITSIIMSTKERYFHAAILIIFATFFDFLDGFIARISRTTSLFGKEYDSLTDMVTFGIAPAMLIYLMELSHMGRWGLGITFLYSVAGALRLARFNSKLSGDEKKEFSGMPTTASALILASGVLTTLKLEYAFLHHLIPVLEILFAGLMVSNIPYFAFGQIGLLRLKHPFVYLACAVLSLGGLIFMAELFLFVVGIAYAFWGIYREISPKIMFLSKLHKKREITGDL